MKSQKQMVPGAKPVILLALCLMLGTHSNARAQALPSASWACGTYSSQDNPPESEGSVVSFNYDQTSQNQAGTAQDIENAYIVFSTKGFAYDTNGNVTGYEIIVRPSAGAQSQVSWSGLDTPGTSIRTGAGPSAWAYYYARISPNAGAPVGVTVPLNIRVFGFAECSTSYYVAGWNSYASASSGVSCSGGSVTGSADATYDQPHAEYDQSQSINALVGETISCNVAVQAVSLCNVGDPAESNGQAQASADPSIEIDPSYAFKDLFFVEYSQDNLFTPRNPVSLALQNVSNGCATIQLTAPTNHVYELQAATDGLSTNWQAIALATNISGSVIFTNCQAAGYPQQFYRARVVRIAQ
jgi:hypothetical protein